MIAARDFADRDEGIHSLGYLGRLDGNNDGVWCQSSKNLSDIGSWQLPNGSAISDNLSTDPIHMGKASGQVGLLRAGSIGYVGSPYQGMYTCTIPDEYGVNQTLIVWAAGNAVYSGETDKNREFNNFCMT